jgi:hypothetical protein
MTPVKYKWTFNEDKPFTKFISIAKIILSIDNAQLLFLSGQDIRKRTVFGVMVLNIFNAALRMVLTFSLPVSTFCLLGKA